MKVMVVGSGGRKHTLAWKLARLPKVQVVYVAPGNGGTALDRCLQNLLIADPEVLAVPAERGGTHFTVVGPEVPLVVGIVDLFHAKGLCILGPAKAAAQLEPLKNFTKASMYRYGIPTAKYQTFSDAVQTHAYIDQEGVPIVVKAGGLTAGKGVVVAMTAEEAHNAIDMMLADSRLGDAGACVATEEFLTGEEASFIVVCDGKNVVALAISQDHKRLLDGDVGLNTGGMDAYSPAPAITPTLYVRTLHGIIMPTIRGMEEDGIPYIGFLHAGLMVDAEGNPKTLEFNCRMGDPETQPIMARTKTDLYGALDRAISGKLDDMELDWDRRTALGAVMAAHSYPDTPCKGDVTIGISKGTEDSVTFHAGTTLKGGVLTINGGQVLCVVGLTDIVKAAQRVTYNTIEQIHFDGTRYRTDIEHRVIRH